MAAEPRAATTLLLLRDRPDGFEIFMVQRHRRSGFLPNAWVFPGGRVDPRDALLEHPAVRGGDALLQRLGLGRDRGLPFLVAGVRETFEEAGIWLGDGSLPEEVRQPLATGDLDLGELLHAHDATVDLDRLEAWSWWVTPEAEPRRYDTRFLVARVDGGGRHCDAETVASGWFDPRAVIADATLPTFPLAPPTWWTLRELAAHGTVDEVLAAARARPQPEIQPVMRFRGEGLDLLLPGHPDHPQPAIEGLPTRVIFEDDRWVAFDGDVRLPTHP